MAVRDEMRGTTTLEQQTYDAWKHGAHGEVRFGLCAGCDRVRDDDGRPLLVAKHGRRWLCLRCFDLGPGE